MAVAVEMTLPVMVVEAVVVAVVKTIVSTSH
jgi:hypothetical protein